AMLMLLYRSGLRVSEVLALRAADINLSEHTVRVLHGKGDKGGRPSKPKSGSGLVSGLLVAEDTFDDFGVLG
ncbi:MAG: tyrosine-type recombinase/integrase, partial [Streptosporangiaceae bacterium]